MNEIIMNHYEFNKYGQAYTAKKKSVTTLNLNLSGVRSQCYEFKSSALKILLAQEYTKVDLRLGQASTKCRVERFKTTTTKKPKKKDYQSILKKKSSYRMSLI